MTIRSLPKYVLAFALIVLIGAGNFLLLPARAIADSVTSFSDVLTRTKASTAADHTILFTTPTGVAADDTIILTFDNSTNTGSVDSTDIDLSFDATPDGVCETGDTQMTLAGTPSGTTMGAANTSSTVLTFTNGSTTIAAGSEICIQIGTNATTGATGDQQITNGSAGLTTLVLSGSFGDSGTAAMRIIADDQVVVTATVDPTLTFTLSANSVDLGTLTSGSTGSTSHTISTATNGSGGLAVSYYGATLTNAASDTISAIGGTAAASSQGSEQFGINLRDNATPNIGADVTTNSGSCGYATNYGTADSFAFVASTTTTVTSVSAAADCVYTVSYMANIASTTEAGDYSTTINWIGSATF